MSKNKGKFALGALLGALAGAAAGILLAPKSGKETRKDLAKKAKELSKKGKDFVAKEAEAVKDKIK